MKHWKQMMRLERLGAYDPNLSFKQFYVITVDDNGEPAYWYYIDPAWSPGSHSSITASLLGVSIESSVMFYDGHNMRGLNCPKDSHRWLWNRVVGRNERPIINPADTDEKLRPRIFNGVFDKYGNYRPLIYRWIKICVEKNWIPTYQELVTIRTYKQLSNI